MIFLDSFSSLLGGHFPALFVLWVVLDGLRERSFLLVLDAETFAETGRAIAPHVIPSDFTGNLRAECVTINGRSLGRRYFAALHLSQFGA